MDGTNDMKILFVIDNLGSGGAQRQMVTLASGLKQKGYEVAIFTYFPQNFFEKALSDSSIPVINEPKNDKLGLNIFYKLSRIIKEGKYDIGIAYLKAPNIYLSIAAKLSGTPIKIITSERTRTNFNRSSIVNNIRGWCHFIADAVVFNSYHEKNNWLQKFPYLEKKSITIYNGVETSLFVPSANHFKRSSSLIGVGTLGPDKHIHILIEAIYKLKTEGIIINVDWYGKYVTSNKAYHAYYLKLYKMVTELNLSEQWRWYAPHKKIHEVLPQYDALIHPSILEGLPNVPCEALSCSLPIILSDTLDHPNLVGDNLRGLLFSPGDPTDLSKKIKEFYSMTDEQISSMKEKCRQYSLKELSLEEFIKNYQHLISTLNK